jgi:threonylcarbamoyladenosine tRNA methylthiotransferase MtaB
MPTIAFTSVGCKLNRYEIQVMSEALRPYGFETVPFSRPADCYVINTCSVTSDADFSSRQLIRRAGRRNPNARVIATGCYAQLRPQEISELGVDAVISNRDKENLPAVILQLFNITFDPSGAGAASVITGMTGMTRAFVKIQDGCDDECSFCTIWMARGPVKSRPADLIIEEINKLSENGFKEVALTGVHIGKYLCDGLDFTSLLKALLTETAIARIRMSSLNPAEITDDLISILSSNRKLCPHVHLSVQAGDDAVLLAMGRKYKRADVTAITERLIEAVPGITIGADFIAGFPGESPEAFENTRLLIEQGGFHHLHIFPYSDRPGTSASQMTEKIAAGEKDRRTAILRELGRTKRIDHLKSFIGKKLPVLFENRELHDIMTGLSDNYLRVDAPLERDCLGMIAEVVPYKADGEHLITNIITRPSSAKKS